MAVIAVIAALAARSSETRGHMRREAAEYLRSCYSVRNADKIGPKLVGKSRVADAIAERQRVLQKKLEITQEKVLREVAAVGFIDAREQCSLSVTFEFTNRIWPC